MRLTAHTAPGVRTAVLVCARMLLLIGLVFSVDHAFAAGKIYRCGNQFQDQPCPAASEVTRPAAPRDAQATTARDAAKPISAARPAAVNERPVGTSGEVIVEARR